MFLSANASLYAGTLAATSDEIQPWMVVAIAAGALLALILIVVAARRSRRSDGSELREAMSGAKRQPQAEDGFSDLAAREGGEESAESQVEPSAKPAPKKSRGKGRHAK